MRDCCLLAMIGLTVGCGGAPVATTATPVNPALLPTAGQLQSWQTSIDQFDGGYRPTGSPAHEDFIAWLTQQLSALGVGDVHTEPYAFAKWTPSNWSFELVGGPATGAVPLTGYVPYSGETLPTGVVAGLAYLPAPATALTSLDASSLEADIAASLSAIGGVAGRIVVFEVPLLSLPLSALTGPPVYIDDPTGALTPTTTLKRLELSTMLYVPAALDALTAAGAVGAVGILDVPEPAARGTYGPFFGTTAPNLPAVYVDRDTGAALKRLLVATGPLQLAHLTVDATVSVGTSENIVGVIPGVRTDEEILLSSHTDGPNSLEDNGPVAILGLASYFLQLAKAQRPRTIRIVLTSGHFVGSQGLDDYVLGHLADLHARALAVLELEHLGALEWAELSPGTMALTGQVEPELIMSWPNRPLVDASLAFAQQLPRSVVAGPPILGEGQNFRIVPLIQFLTAPNELLAGHLPQVTPQLTDYDLFQHQVAAFVEMEQSLAMAPAAELGVRP